MKTAIFRIASLTILFSIILQVGAHFRGFENTCLIGISAILSLLIYINTRPRQ